MSTLDGVVIYLVKYGLKHITKIILKIETQLKLANLRKTFSNIIIFFCFIITVFFKEVKRE
jgi:hypothetical protein